MMSDPSNASHGTQTMIRGQMSILLFLVVAIAAPAGPPAVAADPPAGAILLGRCAIEYEHKSLLGTASTGVLQECLVRPGDRVKAGQVLGRLLDQDVRAEIEMRAMDAASDVAVRLNEAKQNEALGRLEKAGKLKARNFVSQEEYNLLKLEAESSQLAVEEAKHKRRLAQIQLRQAEGVARAREFISPFDGIVVEVLKKPGESATLNDPVFRVVGTERLSVTGHLDVGDAWRVQVGQRVLIQPEIPGVELPIEDEEFPGRIVFVDRQISPETQTCKVTAEVENRDERLRDGLSCRMEIDLRAVPDSPAPGGSPAGDRPAPEAASVSTRPVDRKIAPGSRVKPPRDEAKAPQRVGQR